MWDSSTGIEVRVRPYDSVDPYPEFRAPSYSKYYAPARNEAFILAKTNERFVIDVILHSTFRWLDTKAINAGFRIDGGMIDMDYHIRKEKDSKITEFTLDEYENHVDGELVVCGLAFSKTQGVEDSAFLTQEAEDMELKNRGKIQVIVQRSKLEKRCRNHEEQNDNDLCEYTSLPEQSSKKVCIDEGRSHYARAEGKAGKEIKFTFFYTNRQWLEIARIAPIIEFPNNIDTSIIIDSENNDTPVRSDGATTQPCTSSVPPTNATNATSLSVKGDTHQALAHKGKRARSSSLDLSADNVGAAGDVGFVAINNGTPQNDGLALSAKRIKSEIVEDGDPRSTRSSRSSTVAPQGASNANQESNTTTASAQQAAQNTTQNLGNEEIEVMARLEEIRLQRRLRELRRKMSQER